MTCLRCQGLMVLDTILETDMILHGWKCLNCSHWLELGAVARCPLSHRPVAGKGVPER